MPIVAIGFGPADDIHVMRGRNSRPLIGALFIFPTKDVDDGKPFLATDNVKLRQAGGPNVNVTFSITFPNNNAHGATINTGTLPTPGNPAGVNGTGVVAAAPLPLPASFPRNFIVTAQVLGTAVGADPPPTFRDRIRVHIHNRVDAVFLSPPSLTARQEPAPAAASPVGFSVLARFDDQVLANITEYGDPAVPATRITWQTTTPALLNIDANTGMITALANASPPFGSVQATLPAELGFPGPNPTGTVAFDVGWSTQRTASPVPGTTSPIPKLGEFNLLLLPDGYLAAEQGRFEAHARNLLKKWKDTPAVAPFGMMPLNAFTVWVASAQQGTTVRNPLFYSDRTAGSQKAVALEQVPAAGVPQTLAELVYVVGLPTIAEAATPFVPTKQNEWNALYGAAIAGVNPALHGQWTAISDYVLAAETDTAFGSASGRPPQLLFPDDGRRIEWHQRRAQRTDVDKMLKALVDVNGNPIPNVVDPVTGAVLGNIWTAPLPENGRLTIAMLASGGLYAGAGNKSVELGGPGEMIFSSLSNEPIVPLANVVGGRNFPALRPYPLPSKLPVTTVARVTHELGHGLTLGDEYGGTHQAEGFMRDFARANYANVQAEVDVTDPNTALISGSRILWQSWPRISAAGLVIADVTGVNPNYDVTLRPGHGALFVAETPTIPGDTVRLRKRPFYGPVGAAPNVHLEYLPESIEFTVKTITRGAAGDVLRIVRAGTAPFNAGDYKANKAILFASQGTLKMVHPAVVQSINTRHLPLNRLFQNPPNPAPSCFDDHLVRQGYPNAILGIKDRKPRAWVVGLCDGGAEFYCGMFHPRGTCMMRALQVSYTQPNIKKKKGYIYDFCPICRYIIVDKIDPSLHGKMDQLYEKIYPVAL